MSALAQTRSLTSRFLISEKSALSRRVGARRATRSAVPLARRTSYLRAKNDDKSADSEVVAKESAVVSEASATSGANEVVSTKGSVESADGAVADATESVGVEAQDSAAGAVAESEDEIVEGYQKEEAAETDAVAESEGETVEGYQKEEAAETDAVAESEGESAEGCQKEEAAETGVAKQCACCPPPEGDASEEAKQERLELAEEKMSTAMMDFTQLICEEAEAAKDDIKADTKADADEGPKEEAEAAKADTKADADEGPKEEAEEGDEEKEEVAGVDDAVVANGTEEAAEPVVEPTASETEPVGAAAPAAAAVETEAEDGGSTEGESSGGAEEEQPVQYTNIGPPPKMFYNAEGQLGEVSRAGLGSMVRLFSGLTVQGYTVSTEELDESRYSMYRANGQQSVESGKVGEFKRPTQPLELYEYESCPFCKKVREAVSILDLDVIFYPCPRNGPTFRPKAIELGGKQAFPYLVDPGAGKAMYESDDIIKYLFEEYGDGQVPLGLRLGVGTALSCGLALAGRMGKGGTYREAKMPEKPLIVWSFEASPYGKLVREVLCELELPHLMKSVARGSPKRQEVYEMEGVFMAPYLQDPNTGSSMFESKTIIEYLYETYAVSPKS